MTYLDKEVFERVVQECPEVKVAWLENLLDKISAGYARSIIKNGTADYRQIRDHALECCGLMDLFRHEIYKSAAGKYYNYKRTKEKQEGYSVGTVELADRTKVLVVASKDVKILFRAKQPRGELSFGQIDNGLTRYARPGKSTRVSSELFNRAKRQALAVMNRYRQ